MLIASVVNNIIDTLADVFTDFLIKTGSRSAADICRGRYYRAVETVEQGGCKFFLRDAYPDGAVFRNKLWGYAFSSRVNDCSRFVRNLNKV